ncbi:MAG: oligosaccharide flippase family protein [Proteobacteria bacterium]|nr:oligosaccharide flippase family protein [Pseudomonadota bacterium]
MDSHRQHLSRGFNWLGGATIIAKIIDFSTILVVLLFLTKEQVGIASLVVSIGMIIEAFDGLGTADALVQAPSVSRLQLDTLFWFIVGAALVVAALTLLAAPWIAVIYGAAGMATYFLAIAAKQPLVAAAVIPLAVMNRNLQFERIAIVNVCATFGAAMTRFGLAIAGAGAWALVAGYTASGLFLLLGASLASPFKPRLRFHMPAIAPLLHFGIRAGTSNIVEQVFKNVDYLLIGWFYGPAPLAIYLVAFEVAMEPAMAIGTLVNRTALPVFAKIAAMKDQLSQALIWSVGRIATLVAPLMMGLILVANPLMALLHDGQGHSYAAAALPLKLLAGAALLRVISQILYPLMMATGRPGSAARLSAATLILLTMGIAAAGLSFPAKNGIIAVSVVWFSVYPVLIIWGIRHLRAHWNIRAADFLQVFGVPAAGICALAGMVEIGRLFIPSGDLKIQTGLVLAAAALTYAGLFLRTRYRRPMPAM